MAVCANCSRELAADWKFCIYCGTPTGVPVTAAIAALRAAHGAARGAGHTAIAPATDSDSDLVPGPDLVAAPPPAPAPAPAHDVLRAEDIPADEPAPAMRPRATPAVKVNILAVLALILGCLVSPLAALFGHLALSQISHTGERGTAIAWVAIVLGYLSLAALLVLGISYLVLNA